MGSIRFAKYGEQKTDNENGVETEMFKGDSVEVAGRTYHFQWHSFF